MGAVPPGRRTKLMSLEGKEERWCGFLSCATLLYGASILELPLRLGMFTLFGREGGI